MRSRALPSVTFLCSVLFFLPGAAALESPPREEEVKQSAAEAVTGRALQQPQLPECECMDTWTSPDDAGCAADQYGCPATSCDGGLRWCMIKTTSCTPGTAGDPGGMGGSYDYDGDSTTQNNWMNCLSDPPCRDENNDCGSWASSGECALNPSYMLSNCMVSCGACPGAAALCADTPNVFPFVTTLGLPDGDCSTVMSDMPYAPALACAWTAQEAANEFSTALGVSWTPPTGFGMDALVAEMCPVACVTYGSVYAPGCSHSAPLPQYCGDSGIFGNLLCADGSLCDASMNSANTQASNWNCCGVGNRAACMPGYTACNDLAGNGVDFSCWGEDAHRGCARRGGNKCVMPPLLRQSIPPARQLAHTDTLANTVMLAAIVAAAVAATVIAYSRRARHAGADIMV